MKECPHFFLAFDIAYTFVYLYCYIQAPLVCWLNDDLNHFCMMVVNYPCKFQSTNILHLVTLLK